MQALQTILAALFPTIVVIFFVCLRDKFDKIAFPKILIVFLSGILIFVVAYFLETFFHSSLFAAYFLAKKSGASALLQLGLLSFTIVAAVEELLKYTALRLVAYNPKLIREPMDGIVIAVCISMGFAFAENWLYISHSQAFLPTFILRSLTATPAHAVFAMAMGYFFGKARFTVIRKRAMQLLWSAVIPVIMHGSYNFFIIADWMPLYYALVSVGLLCGFMILSGRMIKKALKSSPFSRKNKWQKSISESRSEEFLNKLSLLKYRLQQRKPNTEIR